MPSVLIVMLMISVLALVVAIHYVFNGPKKPRKPKNTKWLKRDEPFDYTDLRKD